MALADCLARIDARDTKVRGWVHLDRTAQGGEGPLAGVVLGVKDVIDVAGMPTAHGSPIYSGNLASADAEAVTRLRAAGAIVLGKTVTAEFATYHPGPTINPRKPGHTPGGSSSGSAAVVADGQADIALGTQTAGSMIRPASFCGTLGFKPSFGRYPLEGVLETSPNLDTLGLFARTPELMLAADAVLSGDDAAPAIAAQLRIGLCRMPCWDEADAEMQTAFLRFGERLAEAGHLVRERAVPAAFDNLSTAQTIIHDHESWLTLGHIARDHPDRVSTEFRAMMERGVGRSGSIYHGALAVQNECKAMLPALFDGLDMLIAPGAPGAAPEGLSATGNPAFQRIWTALGVPCLGFPAEWRADGLPLGLQLIGQTGNDRFVLAAAMSLVSLMALKERE